jgi:hypothetical protein
MLAGWDAHLGFWWRADLRRIKDRRLFRATNLFWAMGGAGALEGMSYEF